MNESIVGIVAIVFQIIAVGVFIWLVFPVIKQERWKEKFWHNPTAKALVITFIVLGVSIALFRFAIDQWLAVEVLK